MTDPTTTTSIEIPRLDGETSRQYAARVEYLAMGPGRSLVKLAEVLRQKRGKTAVRSLEEWSSAHRWREHAAAYDRMLADLAAQAHARQYQHELEKHRDRARKVSGELYDIARALLMQCGRAVRGQVIKGADGNEYTIPAMDLTPATMNTAMRGLLAALDLEAHALGVDELLPRIVRPEGDEP